MERTTQPTPSHHRLRRLDLRPLAVALVMPLVLGGCGGEATATAGTVTRQEATAIQGDDTVVPGSIPRDIDIVTQPGGEVLVYVEHHASRPLGAGRCGAGLESWLRVLRGTAGAIENLGAVKIASCHTDLELAEPGVTWDAATREVTVRWLEADGVRTARWHVAPDGRLAERQG